MVAEAMDDTTTAAEGTSGSSTGDSGTSASGTSGSPTGGSSTGDSGRGTGQDSGIACPQDFDPVCGVDGNTYDNACVAGVAGVEVRREGPCLGDCEGSCVVAPQGPSLLSLVLVVLAVIRPRRARIVLAAIQGTR